MPVFVQPTWLCDAGIYSHYKLYCLYFISVCWGAKDQKFIVKYGKYGASKNNHEKKQRVDQAWYKVPPALKIADVDLHRSGEVKLKKVDVRTKKGGQYFSREVGQP